jgi:hypothetical protein
MCISDSDSSKKCMKMSKYACYDIGVYERLDHIKIKINIYSVLYMEVNCSYVE